MTDIKILKLDGGHAFGISGRAMADVNEPMDHVMNLDQYELENADLSAFHVLVITDFIDQEYLLEKKDIIEQFLNEGKIVVACTHIFRPWLPGVNLFMPKMIRNHSDYEMQVVKEGSFFHGVDMKELAYRKGVSGFYSRGYHPLTNKDAEVLLAFLDGTPITYIDRTTTKGTIVAHSARDLLTYSTGENSTQLIAKQFMEWLVEEVERLGGGKDK